MDRYANYAQLTAAEREGIDFEVCVLVRNDVPTVVLAPHGGGIEPGTSEVAKWIAGEDLSYAVFEGRKSTRNSRLHIASTSFDEPCCLALVQAADYVFAIHGEGSQEPVVYLGGRDAALGERIRTALESDGYSVERHANPDLQGMAPANVCNRGRRRAGVQLELSSGLRKMFFDSLNAVGRLRPTRQLGHFAAAVRRGLRDGGAL